MLDPWIVEEIVRREEDKRYREHRVELPLEPPRFEQDEVTKPEESERGVVVIDM